MANLSVARIQDNGSKNRFVSAIEEKINFVYKNSLIIVRKAREKCIGLFDMEIRCHSVVNVIDHEKHRL